MYGFLKGLSLSTAIVFSAFILLLSTIISITTGCGLGSSDGVHQDGQRKTAKTESEPVEYELEEETAGMAMEAEAPVPEMMTDEAAGSVDWNTDEYDLIVENEFLEVTANPLSTFSIDVDNASYSNIRSYLEWGELPPKDAVRIEEMVNYFDYEYPDATGEHPFVFITELSECPWEPSHQLLHLGIQGKKLDYEELHPSNLVFLIDSSGSMQDDNKLPLLKKSLGLLLDELDNRDRVAIVAYAGSAGLILDSTPATEKNIILDSINKLEAGGSTAGGEGIELAYKVAEENLIPDGNNRVILATDGDFNVGVSSTAELVRGIEEKRRRGIYLTILGFGMGNYKDGRMEQISNAGNGNYFYIDTMREAEKVFVREMRANMFTIAKDVKIQIEFNPIAVKAYRLIGYENRVMAAEDFDDDTKDAGELGAGHTVTALYELIPAGSDEEVRSTGGLRYQDSEITRDAESSGEICMIKFRYKPPESDTSILIEQPVENNPLELVDTSDNYRFSAAVAGFGLMLRDSKYKGRCTWPLVEEYAKQAKGDDKHGDRAEFIELVRVASDLAEQER